MAITAISQFVEQLSTADCESVRPIATMIGPVTIGGKYFMTSFAPKALNNPARIIYTSPAQATPKHAYGRSSGSPLGAMAKYPARNANDEPRNTGTFLLVTR